MSNLKSLLLQMKLDDNYEMRFIAEEEIVNSYEKLQQENDQLKKALEVAEDALKYMTEDYDCDPEDVALYDRRKALEALEQINKIKKGEL